MRKGSILVLSAFLCLSNVSALDMSDLMREQQRPLSEAYIYLNTQGNWSVSSEITKEELATLIYINLGSPKINVDDLSVYKDVNSMNPEAILPMAYMLKTGLMVGNKDLLEPKRVLSIKEAEAILKQAKWLYHFEIEKDLNILTKQSRAIGTLGEREAVAYLLERFGEMGYEVSTQSYTDSMGRVGSNVIATKKATKNDADILVVSAHHDSAPTTFGANDNASGVVTLLAVAEALKDVSSDTELRFISFTDEENGKNGSRHYVNTLSSSERERMIGDIQLDMLGGYGSEGFELSTCDGSSNWLTDLFQMHTNWLVKAETASDHTSFQLAGIPSLLLMQQGRGYLYHSAVDKADLIRLEDLAQAALKTATLVEQIASYTTPSYRRIAKEQGEMYAYNQIRQNVIYFDSSLKDSENYIGMKGELVDHQVIKGGSWQDVYDTYKYQMRWFNSERPMPTYYKYRNGFFTNIEIKPSEANYSHADILNMMREMFGEPKVGSTRDGKPTYSWTDVVYSKHLSLVGDAKDFKVTVSKFSIGVSNTLANYKVVDGETSIADEKHAMIWEYVCSILPKAARAKIVEFNLFTDGTSGILAFTSPIRENNKTDNTKFAISVDYYDVFDELGNKRDFGKLATTIIHEYGHVLLEDETQIDLSISKDTHDPKGFISGSFRKAFYDKFWKQLGSSGVNDYELHPENYVSRYGANYFHEDIADTFAMFVLGNEPTGNTIAEEKLRMFWQDEAMVNLRASIREKMGLGK